LFRLTRRCVVQAGIVVEDQVRSGSWMIQLKVEPLRWNMRVFVQDRLDNNLNILHGIATWLLDLFS
jgi:hypothetical protein